MKSAVLTASLEGIDCHLIEVQLDVAPGLPCTVFAGNVPKSVQDAMERVNVILRDIGYPIHPTRRIINLSPAEAPKNHMAVDLAITTAFLIHEKIIRQTLLNRVLVLGELDLNGNVLPLPNILPYIFGASRQGINSFLIPAANATEASYVPDVQIIGIENIRQILTVSAAHRDKKDEFKIPYAKSFSPIRESAPDFSSIKGEPLAKMALEVAVAGHFHVLLSGAPGTGKTSLIHCLPGILPLPTVDECLEMTALHSSAGMLPQGMQILNYSPFQRTSHTLVSHLLCIARK